VMDYVAFIVSGSSDAGTEVPSIRNTVSSVRPGFKLNPGQINFAEKLKSARSNFCIIFQINTSHNADSLLFAIKPGEYVVLD